MHAAHLQFRVGRYQGSLDSIFLQPPSNTRNTLRGHRWLCKIDNGGNSLCGGLQAARKCFRCATWLARIQARFAPTFPRVSPSGVPSIHDSMGT